MTFRGNKPLRCHKSCSSYSFRFIYQNPSLYIHIAGTLKLLGVTQNKTVNTCIKFYDSFPEPLRVPRNLTFGWYRYVFPPEGGEGLKCLRYESHYTPPPSVEIKNIWIYTSTPSYAFTSCTWTILLLIFGNFCFTSSPVRTNVCLSLFNLHPLIFGLTPFGWLPFVTLTPYF